MPKYPGSRAIFFSAIRLPPSVRLPHYNALSPLRLQRPFYIFYEFSLFSFFFCAAVRREAQKSRAISPGPKG
ncbi:hypothetical protein HMPREF0262_01773 [Clostridium sp. ATCC 29733]|nr:hypothetical protein HMPREF0262_01773 [Clostridium sp. ATCC 29733]